MNDLILIEYLFDEEYQLGAFKVKSDHTGEIFILDPSTNPCVLYFDTELFCWMIDQDNTLEWDKELQQWVA